MQRKAGIKGLPSQRLLLLLLLIGPCALLLLLLSLRLLTGVLLLHGLSIRLLRSMLLLLVQLLLPIHARGAATLLLHVLVMVLLIGAPLVVASVAHHARQRLTRFQRCRLVTALLLHPPMPSQRIASRESFAADLANVRLVSGMHSAVTLEIVLAGEGAWTDGAGERLELRVRTQMSLEVVRAVLGKRLVAVRVGAFGDAVDIDACVHRVSKRVDHVVLMRVQTGLRHEAGGRVLHTVAVGSRGWHHASLMHWHAVSRHEIGGGLRAASTKAHIARTGFSKAIALPILLAAVVGVAALPTQETRTSHILAGHDGLAIDGSYRSGATCKASWCRKTAELRVELGWGEAGSSTHVVEAAMRLKSGTTTAIWRIGVGHGVSRSVQSTGGTGLGLVHVVAAEPQLLHWSLVQLVRRGPWVEHGWRAFGQDDGR